MRINDQKLVKIIENVAGRLADDGRLIDAGWRALALNVIPETTPNRHMEGMRKIYFAGAQHLFSSILATMDGGKEPSERDMRRLDLINKELEEFVNSLGK